MSYEQKRLKFLSEKYGIAGRLQIEGDKAEAKDESLKELVRHHERDMERGHTLHSCTASIGGGKDNFRVWFSVRQ